MASIKDLKKDINYLTYELLEECYVYKRFHDNPQKAAEVDKVIVSIINKRCELINKLYHPGKLDTKKMKKDHYSGIIASCNAELVGLLDNLKNL